MNKQRQEIYAFRNEILLAQDIKPICDDVLESLCDKAIDRFLINRSELWDIQGYADWIISHFPVSITSKDLDDDYLSAEEIKTKTVAQILDAFNRKLRHEASVIAAVQHASGKEVNPIAILQEVLKNLLVTHIDKFWQEHLLSIDHLRTDVNLRVVGQKDPLLEFKHEAFALFDTFTTHLKTEVAHALFKFAMIPPQAKPMKNSIERLRSPQGPKLLEPTTTLLHHEEDL